MYESNSISLNLSYSFLNLNHYKRYKPIWPKTSHAGADSRFNSDYLLEVYVDRGPPSGPVKFLAITHAPLVSAIIIPEPLCFLLSPCPFNFQSSTTVYCFIYSTLSPPGIFLTPFQLPPLFILALVNCTFTFFLQSIATIESFSFPKIMASSSSSSRDSDSDSGREMTPEFDLQASYEVLAPLH